MTKMEKMLNCLMELGVSHIEINTEKNEIIFPIPIYAEDENTCFGDECPLHIQFNENHVDWIAYV